jgi:hypothetical protein
LKDNPIAYQLRDSISLKSEMYNMRLRRIMVVFVLVGGGVVIGRWTSSFDSDTRAASDHRVQPIALQGEKAGPKPAIRL